MNFSQALEVLKVGGTIRRPKMHQNQYLILKGGKIKEVTIDKDIFIFDYNIDDDDLLAEDWEEVIDKKPIFTEQKLQNTAKGMCIMAQAMKDAVNFMVNGINEHEFKTPKASFPKLIIEFSYEFQLLELVSKLFILESRWVIDLSEGCQYENVKDGFLERVNKRVNELKNDSTFLKNSRQSDVIEKYKDRLKCMIKEYNETISTLADQEFYMDAYTKAVEKETYQECLNLLEFYEGRK